MHSRGQASIEFIFVLVFMFVLLVGVILPLGQTFQSSLDDVGRAGALSSSVKQLEYSFALLASTQASGKQVVGVFIPRDSNVTCNPTTNVLQFSLPLALPVFNTDGTTPSSCVDLGDDSEYSMVCTKTVALPSTIDLTCEGEAALPFTLETGGLGFTQSVTLDSVYTATGTPPYVIDLRTGG